LVDGGLDDPERADRGVVAGLETVDRVLAGAQGKVARPHAHLYQRASELAAYLGQVGCAIGRPKRALDLALA
jgi:hypothetical protein